MKVKEKSMEFAFVKTTRQRGRNWVPDEGDGEIEAAIYCYTTMIFYIIFSTCRLQAFDWRIEHAIEKKRKKGR